MHSWFACLLLTCTWRIGGWHLSTVCRAKTALMASVNTMADEVRGYGKAISMANAAHRAAPRWSDPATGDDWEWWKTLPSRTETGQVGMAKVLHLWVRAYQCSLEANAGVVGVDSAGCRDILAAMKAAANLDSNGHVKMGPGVESFAACPGDVFYHTLCLLNWAGHLCAYGTLNSFNYAITSAVLGYWAGRSRHVKVPGLKVCRYCNRGNRE